jgi:hypothetical protein
MSELADSAWVPFLLVIAAIVWFGFIAALLIGEWMILGILWRSTASLIARIRVRTRDDSP